MLVYKQEIEVDNLHNTKHFHNTQHFPSPYPIPLSLGCFSPNQWLF